MAKAGFYVYEMNKVTPKNVVSEDLETIMAQQARDQKIISDKQRRQAEQKR